jgi:hypothetical protein
MRAPVFAALVFSALASCQANDEAIFIEGVLPPDKDCLVSSAGLVFLPSGAYDLGGAQSGYTAALKVRTNLPSTFKNSDVGVSPNYPNYGPVDNNIVIFDSAEVEYELQTDAATGVLLAQNSNGQLSCDAGVCTIGPRTVTASGTVFNSQTNLNTASLVATELIPLDLAERLKNLNDNLGANGPLAAPGGRLKLIATVSVVGSTTGSGEIRKVKSFPLPYPIDLCVGCLVATEEFCTPFNAVAVTNPSTDKICSVGQDQVVSACFCYELDNAQNPVLDPVTGKPKPTGTIVTDADSCPGGGGCSASCFTHCSARSLALVRRRSWGLTVSPLTRKTR